jgi:hypothetical protein
MATIGQKATGFFGKADHFCLDMQNRMEFHPHPETAIAIWSNGGAPAMNSRKQRRFSIGKLPSTIVIENL